MNEQIFRNIETVLLDTDGPPAKFSNGYVAIQFDDFIEFTICATSETYIIYWYGDVFYDNDPYTGDLTAHVNQFLQP